MSGSIWQLPLEIVRSIGALFSVLFRTGYGGSPQAGPGSKRPDTWLVGGLALVVILGAGLMMVRQLRPHQAVNNAPYEALGKDAVPATAGLLNGRGKIVVWAGELKTPAGRAIDVTLAAFQKALKSHRDLTVQATVRDPVTPPDPAEPGTPPTLLTADRLRELRQTYADSDALVLVGGFPTVSPDELEEWRGTAGPRVVVLKILGAAERAQLETGVVSLALEIGGGVPGSPEQPPSRVISATPAGAGTPEPQNF